MSESESNIKNGFNRSAESSNGLGRRTFTRTLETLPTTRGTHVQWSALGKKEEEKCSYLLIWYGEKGRDIANTWNDVTEEDKKKLKTYFERFSNHVKPKCNPLFFRYKFHKRVQAVTSRFANVRFTNVLSRFANVFSRFANVVKLFR